MEEHLVTSRKVQSYRLTLVSKAKINLDLVTTVLKLKRLYFYGGPRHQ